MLEPKPGGGEMAEDGGGEGRHVSFITLRLEFKPVLAAGDGALESHQGGRSEGSEEQVDDGLRHPLS